MKDEKSDIIIIRGVSGSGKSETAKCLSRYFPKGVLLEVDTIRKMVISVDWGNKEEHFKMLQISAGLTYDFIRFGFNPVILIDTFRVYAINEYAENFYRIDKKLSIKVFGLFTTENELRNRLDVRKKGEPYNFEFYKRLNDKVVGIKYDGEYQIDTTGLLPELTAEIIYKQLTQNGLQSNNSDISSVS